MANIPASDAVDPRHTAAAPNAAAGRAGNGAANGEDAAYNEQSIEVLRGLDAVRKRPGMYIGDTDDGSGLHHMIYEVVDNAIDEALAGYCDTITVTLNRDGVPEAPLAEVGPARPWREGTAREGTATGTEITFLPSPQTFTKTEFDFTTLEHRLRELAFLNSGVTLVLSDLRGVEPKSVTLHFEGGLEAFVRYLDRSKQALHTAPIVIRGERDGILLEIAMEWTDSYHETMLSFTNTIPQRDAAPHPAGFRAALTRTVNAYANDSGIAKKEKVALVGEDMREGLTCILSAKLPDPKFSSQTKDKLVSSEVRPVIEGLGGDPLQQWFEEHPADARKIIGKAVEPAAAREAAA